MLKDSASLILAIAALISAAGGFLAVWIKLRQVHQQFNSRMDELLIAKSAVAHAEGKAEGRDAQREETLDAAKRTPTRD